MEPTTAVVPAGGGEPAAPNAIARVPAREQLVVTSDIALLDTAQFEHMQRIGRLMAQMDLLPAHLRSRPYWFPKRSEPSPAEISLARQQMGQEAFDASFRAAEQRTIANCILVVDQALRWGMNPFSIMGETYEAGGKLAYQGKLVAAVVNARAGITKRLDYTFAGEGKDRTVTVAATFRGESLPRTADLRWEDARTDNKMWTKDPDQKLIYSAVVKWARRWCPEIVLGIQTDDDLERIAIEHAALQPQRVGSSLDAFATVGALPAGPPSNPMPPGLSAGTPLSSDPPAGMFPDVLENVAPRADALPPPAADPEPPQPTPQAQRACAARLAQAASAALEAIASESAPPAVVITGPGEPLTGEQVSRLANVAKSKRVDEAHLRGFLNAPELRNGLPWEWLSRFQIPDVTAAQLELRVAEAINRLGGRR